VVSVTRSCKSQIANIITTAPSQHHDIFEMQKRAGVLSNE
jgi:hypothetical protein